MQAFEAELADHEAALGPALSELLRSFNKPGKELLLVLNEAQALADPVRTELAHSLRAELDSRKPNVKVAFPGSSESTLVRCLGSSVRLFTTERRWSRSNC
jgi:hypothetical protein